MKAKPYVTSEDRPITLALCLDVPYHRNLNFDSYCEEFFNLIRTNRLAYDHALRIKLRSIDATYFFTKGKLQEIQQLCEKEHIEEVIISEPLTTRQERNLTDFLHCNIFDRTQLILEIFEKAAGSLEGKTQVAIAMLQHKKTRVAGKGIHLAQQAGHIGVRGGFGETAKEKELRHINESILKLKKQLKKMSKARETQRKRRISAQIPHICLIGYTNAGKSSLLNALTKSDVFAEDILFATLDTTTRELYINSVKKGVISDTVGFIQNLPHQLVEAFKSTLSELEYADLLLHVVDLSNQNWKEHISVVNALLEELQISKPVLYVFNKLDKVENMELLETEIQKYQPHLVISTQSKKELQPLVTFLETWNI